MKHVVLKLVNFDFVYIFILSSGEIHCCRIPLSSSMMTFLIIIIFRLDGPRDVDSLFGKAKFFEMRRNFSGALELVNQVNYLLSETTLVKHSDMPLALDCWLVTT